MSNNVLLLLTTVAPKLNQGVSSESSCHLIPGLRGYFFAGAKKVKEESQRKLFATFFQAVMLSFYQMENTTLCATAPNGCNHFYK